VIAGTTKVVVVIGDPIEHTRSPAMLNAAFAAMNLDLVMVPLHVVPASLAAAVTGLAATGVVGASVTLPHKSAVVASCTQLTEDARRIGAVNCLTFDRGEILGDNTDGAGFVAALAALVPALLGGGKRAVLLGGGGAACAVEAALISANVTTTVIARRPDAAACRRAVAWDPATLERELAGADLVVDCTPVGLGAAGEAAFVDALPLDRLPAHAVVATLVYHREPLLLARARARGHAVVDGRGMLVHQAARAFARWTGRAAPVAVMQDALDRSLA
jgi:shikimate dehydrogenase